MVFDLYTQKSHDGWRFTMTKTRTNIMQLDQYSILWWNLRNHMCEVMWMYHIHIKVRLHLFTCTWNQWIIWHIYVMCQFWECIMSQSDRCFFTCVLIKLTSLQFHGLLTEFFHCFGMSHFFGEFVIVLRSPYSDVAFATSKPTPRYVYVGHQARPRLDLMNLWHLTEEVVYETSWLLVQPKVYYFGCVDLSCSAKR